MALNNPSDGSSNFNLKILLKLVNNYHPGFQVCHLNARSLNQSKLDYLNYIFDSDSVCIDVVCITERWFKYDINDNIYNLHDFCVVRNDRHLSERSGGIAIYHKNTLLSKIIYKSDELDPVDFLMVEFYNNFQRCLVICIYNPNKSYDLSNLFLNIYKYSAIYEHILLCGDLNIDLLVENDRTKNLLDNMSSAGLNVINKLPTRFGPHSKPGLLDLFCVSDVNNVLHFEQLSLSGVSDHDLIFLSYNLVLRPIINSSPETFIHETLTESMLKS